MTNCTIPQGYKATPLGIIPQEWEVKRLGEISVSISSGKNKYRDREGQYPVYGSTGIIGFSSEFRYEGTSILVARVGANAGILNLVSGKYDVSDNTLVVIAKSNLYDYYFAYNQLVYCNLNRLVFGSGQPLITSNQLKNITIPVPPLAEQKKIAEVLGVWDRAIEKQSQLIEQLTLRKRGLMQQLLTGKKRLPGFSGEWRKEKAGSIFENSSVRSNKLEPLLSATQEYGVVPRDMLETRVTMPSGNLSSFKRVDIGDFVISLRSFEGGIEYSKYSGIVSPAYTVLKKKHNVNDIFYKAYFKSHEFIQRLAIAVIGIRDGKQISYSDFCYIRIPLPSFEEQTAIAQVLTAADREIELAQQKLELLRQQKRGLMQQLLTGKKRVNHGHKTTTMQSN